MWGKRTLEIECASSCVFQGDSSWQRQSGNRKKCTYAWAVVLLLATCCHILSLRAHVVTRSNRQQSDYPRCGGMNTVRGRGLTRLQCCHFECKTRGAILHAQIRDRQDEPARAKACVTILAAKVNTMHALVLVLLYLQRSQHFKLGGPQVVATNL